MSCASWSRLNDLERRIEALEDWRGDCYDTGTDFWPPEKALAGREKALAEREKALAEREKALAEREDTYERAVAAKPPPCAHPKDAWLTDRAGDVRYAQFILAGWTDALLEQHGYMEVPKWSYLCRPSAPG